MALIPVIVFVMLTTIDMKAVPDCTGHRCPEIDWSYRYSKRINETDSLIFDKLTEINNRFQRNI